MPCLVVLIALAFPRMALFLIWLFSDNYLGNAYQTVLWPVLGFFFMPFTTLAFAAAINQHGSVSGIWLVLVIVAAIADLSTNGGSTKARRRVE